MTTENTLSKFSENQIDKWRKIGDPSYSKRLGVYPVITVNMAPGSGGSIVAQKVATLLGFDYFDRELLEAVAQSAEVTPRVLEKLEKERFSGFQDFIASLLDEHYIWPGVYLDHLRNMVNAISRRGHAVIVGRGAAYLLPQMNRLSVRVVAPMEDRIQNVMRDFKVSEEEANKRILYREARRANFIKKSFHSDINDPTNYDLVINTSVFEMNAAAEIICAAWAKKFYE
ncbi:MAG: cytidylate kinase-like family protein [Desulfobacterales bacterium]|jgi:cytidylate kinase|nr:cytidylate kinase-like family protein [Desulfobacterales bacterium]